jgi:hypothetical protein
MQSQVFERTGIPAASFRGRSRERRLRLERASSSGRRRLFAGAAGLATRKPLERRRRRRYRDVPALAD